MTIQDPGYRALVSSDWSECLSPNGPFDPIAFSHPQLAEELAQVFREYTGNRISLTRATSRIAELLPGPITLEQMDAYLDAHFEAYQGVPELMEWCLENRILFMINTTGSQGYFQRVFAKGLLPQLPFVAANPMIRFPGANEGSRFMHEIHEIEDKPRRTEAVMKALNIPSEKVVIMGDSGGDGPHFQWGAENGAFIIGNMTKPSLAAFCEAKGIRINFLFGHTYLAGEPRKPDEERKFSYTSLMEVIGKALDLPAT